MAGLEKVFYHLRVSAYFCLLLTVSFWAILIGIVTNIIGQRLNTNYYVARTFWYVAGPIVGWKLDVEGEEHLWRLDDLGDGRSAVMVGNHQSAIDILYLARIFPKNAAIMAKQELKVVPGLGWWMMLSGTVFINRKNNKSAVAAMKQVGDEMKRKRISLWIFPEGTRHMSDEPELLPFKKGAFYLAVEGGMPILPVVVQNYSHLFKKRKYFRRGTLRIKVLPPISTVGLKTEDVPELMNHTRELMLKTLREISQVESPSPSPPPSLIEDERVRRNGGYISLPSGSPDHDHDEVEVEATIGAVVPAQGARTDAAVVPAPASDAKGVAVA